MIVVTHAHWDHTGNLQPGARLIVGHDPLVRTRFAQHPANPDVTDLAGATGAAGTAATEATG